MAQWLRQLPTMLSIAGSIPALGGGAAAPLWCGQELRFRTPWLINKSAGGPDLHGTTSHPDLG
jgi:hypothetical protein